MIGRIKDIEKGTKKRIVKELHLIDPDTNKEFTAIGPILNAASGSLVELTGQWVGETFKFTESTFISSCIEEEAQKLLSLDLLLSEPQALEIAKLLEEKPQEDFNKKLLEIDGIGPVRAERITKSLRKEKDREELLRELTKCNAKEGVIFKCFSDTSVTPRDIFNNPYLLINYGESFITCDKIAHLHNINPVSDNRLHGAIKYVINREEASGNTKVKIDALSQTVKKITGKIETENEIPETLSEIYALSDEMLSINKDLSFSFQRTAEYEEKIAKHMFRLSRDKVKDEVRTESFIREAEKELGVTYSDEQREAFSVLSDGGVKLLTGGPGTGKTLTIAGIVKSYMAFYPEKKVLLCAPTGRAAARMKELSGDGASVSTIHKALGLSHFLKGKLIDLNYDLIICDEMSMADTEIMALFLERICKGAKLLLSGDFNQLPSVGPGRVFKDLIESKAFDTVRLTKIARQKSDSSIPINANAILLGMLPTTAKDFDIFYFRNDDEILKATDAFTYKENLMALCPLRKTKYGSEALARKIQKTRSFTSRPVFIGFDTFYEGDLVLLNKNNYDSGYINGDLGIIKSITQSKCEIQVGDRLISVKEDDFSDMSLAYCMTIHKSQGSECENVDVILPDEAGNLLLTRELLYTAVTRAKKRVRIFTTKKALSLTVQNEMVSKRYCGLLEKIEKLA